MMDRRPRPRKSLLPPSAPGRRMRSTRVTWAPRSARIIPQNGAGPRPASSMTLRPDSGPLTGPRYRAAERSATADRTVTFESLPPAVLGSSPNTSSRSGSLNGAMSCARM